MKCSQCNQELSENFRLCPYCGTPVEAPPSVTPDQAVESVHKVCPGCRTVFSTDHVFCDRCGRLLKQRKIEGNELFKIPLLSKHESNSSFGFSKPTGDIIIFDNRIEFLQKAESAAAAFWDAAGMRTSAKKGPVAETYKMDEIASAHADTQSGFRPALVIQLKDQRILSFRGLTDSNIIRKAAELIEEYRN